MRIDLLFGFLGSGKTTLARRILEEWGPKERLGLIVNEFGDVGVDGEILQGNSIDVVELSSGCLCCTLKDSLLSAIEEMAAAAPLDHIVIEATGVAEPEEMLKTFNDPSFMKDYELGPVTTVIDASKHARIRQVLGPFYEAQVEKADMLVLNKIDLADAEVLEQTRAAVKAVHPDAAIQFSERGDIEIKDIMHGQASRVAATYLERETATSHGHDHDHHHDHDHDHGALHAPADSCVLPAPDDVPHQRLTAFFAGLGDDIWRGKGFLVVDGTPSLVQYAMGELEVTPAEARDSYYLVLIGAQVDAESLGRRFADIQAGGAAA